MARWLIFLTSLVLLANQSSTTYARDLLDVSRWVCLALLGFLFLVRAASGRSRRRILRADVFICAFLFYCFASAAWSIDPSLTLQRSLSLFFLYGAAFWYVWDLADTHGSDYVIQPLLWAAMVAFATGLLLLVTPWAGMAWQRDGRFRGLLVNPNSVGLLASLLLPLVISQAIRFRRLFDKALLVVLGVSLALCASRNGLIASLVGALVILSHTRLDKRVALVGGGVTAFLILWSLFGQVIVGAIGASPMAHLITVSRTWSGRAEAWPAAMRMMEDTWWFGHGFGTEELLVRRAYRTFKEFQGGFWHNSYLGIFTQLGIVGATAFFLPLVALCFSRRNVGAGEGALSPLVAVRAAIIAGLVAAMFESWIYSVGNAFAFPFWICVMLLVRGPERARPTVPRATREAPMRTRVLVGSTPERSGVARTSRTEGWGR